MISKKVNHAQNAVIESVIIAIREFRMLREDKSFRAERIQKSFMKEVALEITLGGKKTQQDFNRAEGREHPRKKKSMNKDTESAKKHFGQNC